MGSDTTKKRLALLFEDGIFTELDSGVEAGVTTAYGNIAGVPTYAFCQYGAVDKAHARKVKHLYELAAKTGAPVVGMYSSPGAKVSEGAGAISAVGDILGCASAVSGVVPQIAVVLGVCGGTAAMAAACADIVIASEKAELFLTPPFTARANGDKVKNAGKASFAAEAGVVAAVAKNDEEAIELAAEIVQMLPHNNLCAAPMFDFAQPGPVAAGNLNAIFYLIDDSSAVELYKDFAGCVYTALATVEGSTVGIAAALNEHISADGADKLARFVSLMDSFNIPIVTVLDSVGFEPSSSAEGAGLVRSAARLAAVYAAATSPKVTLVAGNAVGALAAATVSRSSGADCIFAWKGAVISPVTPLAAADILMADKIKTPADVDSVAAEYAAGEGSADSAAEKGEIDGVIEPADTRRVIAGALAMLSDKRASTLPRKHANLPW